MISYGAILFSNRDQFEVEFRDSVYPLCQVDFTNTAIPESSAYTLDVMDGIVLCDAAYLQSVNLTQSVTKFYIIQEIFCKN